jgi:hypothetical protein
MSVIANDESTGSLTRFIENSNYETIDQFQAARLVDDFVGPGVIVPAVGSAVSGYSWVSKIVDTEGTPTVAAVSNFSGGAVACALDSTSEAQEATLYAGDVLNWDATKGLVWEGLIALSVLPTGNATAAFGVTSAWSARFGETYRMNFQVGASGVVNYQKADGVATVSASTGVTLTANAFHVFRIDSRNTSAVNFWIDGVLVGNASFGATGASAVLQPLAGVAKASGTGVATLQADRILLAMSRS